MSGIKQVNDDAQLLRSMMNDMAEAEELYKPTNYWEHYTQFFLPELESKGLRDFRRRRNSILNSFGAVDLSFSGNLQYTGKRHIKGMPRMVRALSALLKKMNLEYVPSETSENITKYFYAHVKNKFDKAGLDIHRCPTTNHGNPEDLVVIKDTKWSFAHLQICSMFIDTVADIEFKDGMVFCEIGPGLGRNIEILALLFPHATFIVFDIPPQLYVANQYLCSVFGDRVMSYEAAIKTAPAGGQFKGKIVMLPSWKMSEWSGVKLDIFWNSASFQEMEPLVVQNYLTLVSKMSPKYVYINSLPGGNYWGEWREGIGGTKAPISEENFFEPLADKYELKKRYFTDYFFEAYSHISYIFGEPDVL